MESEQKVDYSKQQSESQIDYIRHPGVLNNEDQEEVREEVDQIIEEGYIEKDMPNEFRERVTIAEPSSNTNPKKQKGRKAQASKSSTTSSAIKAAVADEKIRARSPPRPPSIIHSITWDGFNETCELVGQTCCLCEKDLSISALEEEVKFELYEHLEPVNLPDVAVLACGHAFHHECLESITPEDQCHDPPCFLCLSCIT